jgi:hypothetical protein
MKDKNIVDIEKMAAAHLNRIRIETGITETRLGELAFPESKNKRAKINALRVPRSNTGEPLRFRLGDFCAICHALGKNPAQELLLLWGDADTSNEESPS